MTDRQPILWAVSDIHTSYADNKKILETIRTDNPEDWLIVAGDVTETIDGIISSCEILRSHFARVIWVPGNHELYTTSRDIYQLYGLDRYNRIVEELRGIDVITPEDSYPLFSVLDKNFHQVSSPVNTRIDARLTGRKDYRIVPMFLLYDYSFRPQGWENLTKQQALEKSRAVHVVATDEVLISPQPYDSLDAWCAQRISYTKERLDSISPDEDTILINHWPLIIDPCYLLFDPEFSLWCGTTATSRWHIDYRAHACVYGHLHIPRTTWHDQVRFEEVSLGYPREWQGRGMPQPLLRQILPDPLENSSYLGPEGIRFEFDPTQAIEARKKHELKKKRLRDLAKTRNVGEGSTTNYS